MELEIKAPITVNAFDRTFVETVLQQIVSLVTEVKNDQAALRAQFETIQGNTEIVDQLTERAQANREKLQGMSQALSGALSPDDSQPTQEPQSE